MDPGGYFPGENFFNLRLQFFYLFFTGILSAEMYVIEKRGGVFSLRATMQLPSGSARSGGTWVDCSWLAATSLQRLDVNGCIGSRQSRPRNRAEDGRKLTVTRLSDECFVLHRLKLGRIHLLELFYVLILMTIYSMRQLKNIKK